MRIVRWIFFLPVAVISGYLAYIVGGTLNNFSTARFLGSPLTGWVKVVCDAMAHMYMGATATYVAVKIAPAYPRVVAAGTFGLALLSACASLWSSVIIGKYYAIPAIVGLIFGAVAVLIGTLAGEIAPYGEAPSEQGKAKKWTV